MNLKTIITTLNAPTLAPVIKHLYLKPAHVAHTLHCPLLLQKPVSFPCNRCTIPALYPIHPAPACDLIRLDLHPPALVTISIFCLLALPLHRAAYKANGVFPPMIHCPFHCSSKSLPAQALLFLHRNHPIAMMILIWAMHFPVPVLFLSRAQQILSPPLVPLICLTKPRMSPKQISEPHLYHPYVLCHMSQLQSALPTRLSLNYAASSARVLARLNLAPALVRNSALCLCVQ